MTKLSKSQVSVMAAELDEIVTQFRSESLAVLLDSEAMLMGRNTYQYFAPAWSSPSGPYLERIYQMRKYVFSSTLTQFPARPEQLMPTRLGNVVRAAESRPYYWYGLDAVRCWSRMWLVLPDATKTEISAARADLDTATTWWTWAALTAVWTVFSPWALLIALVGCWLYRALVGAALRFGELVDAAFDLHRGLLYDALGWQRPDGAEAERAQGKAPDRGALARPSLNPTMAKH